MSIEKSLWDIDNMADLVLDGLGPIKSIVSDFFGGDFFSGDGTYPAVVISKPVDISRSRRPRPHQKYSIRLLWWRFLLWRWDLPRCGNLKAS